MSRPALRAAFVLVAVLVMISLGADRPAQGGDGGRARSAGPVPLIALTVTVDGGGFASDETRARTALATVAVLDRLAGHPVLVPHLPPSLAPPAQRALVEWAPTPVAHLRLSARGPLVESELCSLGSDAPCRRVVASAAGSASAAADHIVTALTEDLGVSPAPAVVLPTDRYIGRVTGRAAARALGWTEPTDEEGDPRLRAVRLDATIPLSRTLLGLAQERAGDLDAAAESYAWAARLDPGSSLRAATAAIAWSLADRPRDAEAAWWRCEGATDDRASLLFARAVARPHPRRALRALESLAPAFQVVPAVVALRARAHRAAGDVPAELVALDAWADLAPEDPAPLETRIDRLIGLGRLEEARVDAERLALRAPETATPIRIALALALEPSEALALAQTSDVAAARAVRARFAAAGEATTVRSPEPIPILRGER